MNFCVTGSRRRLTIVASGVACLLLILILLAPGPARAASDEQIQEAIERATEWIEGQQLPSGSLGPDGGLDPAWSLIGMAGAGRHAADLRTGPGAPSAQDYYADLWTRANDVVWASLGTPSATDYERAILISNAIGLSPTRLSADRNLLANLAAFYRPDTGTFGPAGAVNHHIFGLLAIQRLPVAPGLIARSADVLDERLVAANGSWKLPDMDLTGAAIGALCGAGRSTTDPVVAAGVDKLGVSSGNTSSSAWAINGLAMCGIERGSAAWTAADETRIDQIVAAQLPSGAWPYGGGANLYATQDALRALVSPGFTTDTPPRLNPAAPRMRPVPNVSAGTRVPVTVSIDTGTPAEMRFCAVTVRSGAKLPTVLAKARTDSSPVSCVSGFDLEGDQIRNINGRVATSDGGWKVSVDGAAETEAGLETVGFGDTISLRLDRPAPGSVAPDPDTGEWDEPDDADGGAGIRFTTPTGSPFGPTVGSGGDDAAPRSLDVADVDGDGNLDTITVNGNSGTVGVMRGDGHGGFAPAVTSRISSGSPDTTLEGVTGDFDGDDNLDVVVSHSGSMPGGSSGVSGIGLMRGNGDGTFRQAEITHLTPIRQAERGIGVGDLDGDGNLDLAVALAPNPYLVATGPHRLRLLLGDGDGGFTEPGQPVVLRHAPDRTPADPVFPQAVKIDDVNGDGKADVLVTRGAMWGQAVNDVGVSVLLGDGAGGVGESPLSPFATGGQGAAGGGDINATYIRTADMNEDGNLDLVTVNKHKSSEAQPNGSSVSVLLGDGSGRFVPASGSPFPVYAPGSHMPDPRPNSSVVVDLDRDGHLDVAVGNPGDGSVQVLRGTGTGALTYEASAASALHAETFGPVILESGDVNRDGRPDLVVSHQIRNRARLAVLLNATERRVTASARSLSFGSVEVGQRAPAQSVTITNDGSFPVEIGSVESDSPEFAVNGDACADGRFAVGESCVIEVGFEPASAEASNGVVLIQTDAGSLPLSIALRGTGTVKSVGPVPPGPGGGNGPSGNGGTPKPDPRPKGTAKLRVKVVRAGSRRAGSNRVIRYRVTVRNAGSAAATRAKLCFSRSRIVLNRTPCLRLGRIAPNARVARVVRLKVRGGLPRRTKARLRVVATADGATPRRAVLRLGFA